MILDLQTTDDPRDMVHRTVQALVEGHVVGVPTEAFYGLAAYALCERAVQQLCELTDDAASGREPAPGSIAVTLRSREAALDFVQPLSPLTRRLMHRCWPGPLTVVTRCEIQRSAVSQFPDRVQDCLLSTDGEIAFRVSAHRILSHLHRYLSAPLLIATPMVDEQGGATTAEMLARDFQEKLPLLLDDGPTRYGGETSIVRVSGNRWEILREGVIERAAMNQFVKPVIAVVCTGNTCRSPMAETLLREHLRRKFGCEDAVRVVSAGVAASDGCGASQQAIEVMGQRGLDLTGHASRPLDESVINVADLVLTMTRGHREAILAAWPEMHDRVFTLRRDGTDITDPVGMPVESYHACADQIDTELAKWVEALDDDFFPSPTSNPE